MLDVVCQNYIHTFNLQNIQHTFLGREAYSNSIVVPTQIVCHFRRRKVHTEAVLETKPHKCFEMQHLNNAFRSGKQRIRGPINN